MVDRQKYGLDKFFDWYLDWLEYLKNYSFLVSLDRTSPDRKLGSKTCDLPFLLGKALLFASEDFHPRQKLLCFTLLLTFFILFQIGQV